MPNEWGDEPVNEWGDALAEATDRRGGATGNRWLQKLGEGMVPAYNRLTAATAAATDPLLGIDSGATFGDRYQNRLRADQAQSNQTQAEHPYVSAALQTAGGLPGGAVFGTASKVAPAVEGTTRLVRALAAAKPAAGLGAMYGAGNAPADAGIGTIAAHTATGAGVGGSLGAGLGALTPSHVPDQNLLRIAANGEGPQAAQAAAAGRAAAEGGTSSAENMTSISIRPSRPQSAPLLARALQEPEMTPEAKMLSDRGVQLTTGLRDPMSPAAQTEIASQSLKFTGPMIRQQRQSALAQSMDLGFNEALPPGAPKLTVRGGPQQKLDALAKTWNAAYDGVKERLGYVAPAVLEGEAGTSLAGEGGAISRAVRNPEILADDGARKTVEGFVLAKLTKINGRVQDGRVAASDLLSVRADIREAARKAIAARNYERADLLDAAEDQITAAIESQAPTAALESLRALDARYFNFKVMQKAVTRAKDSPAGITPATFSEAVYQTMQDKNAYARGGGGDMRALSGAIRSVFDESSAPPTGARLATLDSLPWVEGAISKWGTGPAIVIRNRQLAAANGGRSDALAQAAARMSGQVQAPSAVQQAEWWPAIPGQQSPLAALVEAMRAGGVRPAATRADDERRR